MRKVKKEKENVQSIALSLSLSLSPSLALKKKNRKINTSLIFLLNNNWNETVTEYHIPFLSGVVIEKME